MTNTRKTIRPETERKTTIEVDEGFIAYLDERMSPGEEYGDVLRRLLIEAGALPVDAEHSQDA